MGTQIKEIAMREIRTRGRSRGFRTITGLMLVLAIAAPIAMLFIPSPTEGARKATIGIAAGAPDALDLALEAISGDAYELKIVDLGDDSVSDIEQRLTRGELDVVVEPPRQLVWADAADPNLTTLISTALNQIAALERADEAGIDADELAELFQPIEVTPRFVRSSTDSEGLRQGVAFFGLFLAFLLPQIFGQLTMLSVVEEKSTRVVEVLLSHVRPLTLLVGKIVGICALAIVQLLLIVAGLIASLLATDAIEVPASVWQFVPMVTISVLFGLAIYTTMFALLGSLISRQEDAAQVMLPIFAPLMIGYFVGQAAIFGNADTVWAKALTIFPLTSPMLLPVRVARAAISPIEIAISLSVLAVSVFALVKLASRVYEFTLLRTGSRVGWAELVRLSRGAIIE